MPYNETPQEKYARLGSAYTRGSSVPIDPNDPQFQSQAQIDAEIEAEAKLAANKNVLGRLTR